MMDEAAFRKDLESDAFQIGILEGYWEIPPAPPAAWPHWFVTVRSNLPTVNGGAVTLRFTLNGYKSGIKLEPVLEALAHLDSTFTG